MTIEEMPLELKAHGATLQELNRKLDQILSNKVADEIIDGDEYRKRLSISRPTEIEMRKRKKVPFLVVNGQYRYNWPEVLKALTHQ